jgi:hypothetical protein
VAEALFVGLLVLVLLAVAGLAGFLGYRLLQR